MATPLLQQPKQHHHEPLFCVWAYHPYQVAGVALSAASLFVYFFFFVNVSVNDHSFISDNLHYYLWFRIFITCVMSGQYVLFILYFTRFWHVRRATCITGILFLVISLAGWFMLIMDYNMPLHMIGFSIFVSGTLVYWITIFVFDRVQYITDNQEYMYFFAAFVFCSLYCVFYVMYNDMSWVYEHIGMLFLNSAQIVFFLHHDPDPRAPIDPKPPSTTDGKYRPLPVPHLAVTI